MNRQKVFWLLLAAALSLALANPFPTRADGIVIPEPPVCDPPHCPPIPLPISQLEIRSHHVTVNVEEQVAVTQVDQVFYNPNDWPVEGTYVFPLPVEAAVTSFSLWMDGEPVKGEMLDAAQARQIYEEIVRSMRDPALLEYAGQGAVQARLFPIPAGGERRISLEYTQALAAENGLVRYVYPLSTEKFSAVPLKEVSISVRVRSGSPVRAVYSPTHPVGILREDDFRFTAGYEEVNVLPDADFALYYSIGEAEAFHILTYRDPSDPSDPDGYFLALLAPRPDADLQTAPKDVLLVLDRSGSMEGEKFRQAQEALKFIVSHLNAEDRFNLIAFSTGLETYADSLRPVSEAEEAAAWVDRLSAGGSTDINRALLEAAAVAEPGRPTYLIFLTDGLPTEGVIESGQILANFSAAVTDDLRLFAFGVGYDVDTYLLDSLSQGWHGASQYVLPGERLDEIISGFYAKISAPVLTNLALDFGEMIVFDLYPNPLPDLFVGSQILVAGRYRDGGQTTVTLTGELNREVKSFHFPDQLFAQDSQGLSGTLAALPRLWATRKVGYLLNRIRLEGPDQETVDQIVKLSIRFGIVTPYTSYLVREDVPLGASEQERVVQDELYSLQRAPAPVYGQEAVEKAAGESALSQADSAAAPPVEANNQIRIVGSRTFVFSNGVWTDTLFDPDRMSTVKIPFLSEEYFALAANKPDLAAAFALGERVIVAAGDEIYEVVPAGGEAQATQKPANLPTDVPVSAPPEPGDQPESGGVGFCPAALFPATLVLLVAAARGRKRL